MPQDECFYKDGLCFECQRCSDCCRLAPGYVYLSKKDLTNLCNWFNMNEEDFIKKYCRWCQYYGNKEVLCLLEKPGYDCILWQDGGCLAYGARPVQCSTYPFWSWIVKSQEAWNTESKDCKGMNQGRLYSASEINEKKFLYEHNVPVTRELTLAD